MNTSKTTQVLIECGLEDSAPSKGIYSQLPNQAALEENRALHKKCNNKKCKGIMISKEYIN